MSTMTAVTIAAPRQPVLDRTVAMRLAAEEYARFGAALRQLSPEDWQKPTCNTGWDVRAMAGHVLGMTHMSASLLEQTRQMRQAHRRGGVFIDALTALQVERNAALSPTDLLDRLARLAPKAVRGRRRMPTLMRRRPMPEKQFINPPEPETWSYAYLVDVILTRDPWMHRSDLAEATGRPMQLTADHDGVLVADVVTEWAGRHGQPCSVRLTGPAGGTWTFGDGGPEVEMDAVDFCRVLSGRGIPGGLLETAVPF